LRAGRQFARRVLPAAAFSRAIIAELRRKSGIDCHFAASFAPTRHSMAISCRKFRAKIRDYFAFEADHADAQSAARRPRKLARNGGRSTATIRNAILHIPTMPMTLE
jgi:hypothetical protein